MELQSKSALVTGAEVGIGRAIAERLAAEGAQVLVCDVVDEAGLQAVADIQAAGCHAAYLHLDVTDPDASMAAVAHAESLFGGLDVAVNNAGISGEFRKAAAHTPETWRKVIDINLSGVFFGVRAQVPAMLRRGGGSIVNISSILGQVGHVDLAPHVAAKHGVVGLTRTVALDYGRRNVRCNAVGPAFIRTRLLDNVPEEGRRGLADLHALGRLGEAKEVAELVTFLASDRASFLTGNYYAADGGSLSR